MRLKTILVNFGLRPKGGCAFHGSFVFQTISDNVYKESNTELKLRYSYLSDAAVTQLNHQVLKDERIN